MSSIQTSMNRFVTLARGEAQLALSGAPKAARWLLVVAAWATLAIVAGAMVGLAAVALPPMGLLGIIGAFALVLLWVLPDGFEPPDRVIRFLLLAVIFSDLVVPNYYSVQIPGLPWISIRRIVTFLLVSIFLLTFSSSRKSRLQISGIIKDNKLIFFFFIGYVATLVLSTFTSVDPFGTINSIVSAALEWYVPVICLLYVAKKEEDVAAVILVICFCAIIISIISIIDYETGKRLYISIMPGFMYENMVSGSEFAQTVLTSENAVRMGDVRVSGPYGVSLSLAEFEAMVAPFGTGLLLHGSRIRDRLFGATVILACFAGIVVSGSRGGYLSFLIANFMFITLMVVRSRLSKPHGLAAPLLAVVSGAGFTLVTLAILFVGRVHNTVFGGAEGDSSTEARWIQWDMARPKFVANPITGYGFGMSGTVIGYRSAPGAPVSVDSYVISILVETGLPSLIFYFGTALAAVWVGARQYLFDEGKGGMWAGGLACSIAGFAAYRFALAQRENQTLFFILVGCVALLHSFYTRAKEPAASTTK